MQIKEYILTITKHRKFGIIFTSYIITLANNHVESFYTSIERANCTSVKEADNFSPVLADIQELISQYNDSEIAGFFTKKKEDAVTFLKNVKGDLIDTRIRPYIERRLIKIYNLLLKAEVRIFFKDPDYTQIYSSDIITLAGNNAETVFNFKRTGNGLQYFLNISYQNKAVSLRNKKIHFLADKPCIVLVDNYLYKFENINSKKLTPFTNKDFVTVSKQSEKKYFESFVYNSVRDFKVKAEGFEIIEDHPIPKPVFYFQNDLKSNPVLLLKFIYGSQIILPNNPESKFILLKSDNDEYSFFKTIRNFKFESEIIGNLKKGGFVSKDVTHFYPLGVENINTESRLFFMIETINKKLDFFSSLNIDIKQTFFDKKYLISNVNLKIKVDKSNDWFDVRGSVQFGNFTIPFVKLRKHILKDMREYKLPDGTIAILPEEWFVKYKKIFELGIGISDAVRFNNFHFGILDEKEEGVDIGGFENIKDFFKGNFENKTPVPQRLNATLRDYQFTGFNWMVHLAENGFGGCLADDMGLGKTVQALTLLLHEQNNLVDKPVFTKQDNTPVQLNMFTQPEHPVTVNEKTHPTSLIVMPTSLIHNWENEIKKFAKTLKTMKYSGNNRTKILENFIDYDIILTTYGVVRNDIDFLEQFPFHYIILDESQAIKNSSSKIYKAVIKLKAANRMVITGTPVENSLSDLWSQMNFVNTGLLGNAAYFKNEFVTPVEKHKDQAKSDMLQALIHPFILRRTKDEVAKELPPKTEQIRYCNMKEEQAKIYEKEKSLVRNTILESMDNNKSVKKGFAVLQALTKLRQLANHPKLIKIKEESGKYDEVIRMLDNIISENHKVLLFSSFVQHLEIYKEYLEQKGLKYSILTGQTRDRQKAIDYFQNTADNHVFLISLKAGGTGLNLTAADYVFLLDPWWNPAAENQAINRAHRIGQDKNVFVYRFITKESIEEKIVNLQQQKSNLADKFVNSNNPFAKLSIDVIKNLFD
jgi:SNF2 family DNA or RNA helicase